MRRIVLSGVDCACNNKSYQTVPLSREVWSRWSSEIEVPSCDTPKAVDMHARAGRDLNHSRTIHEGNTKRMNLSVLLYTYITIRGSSSLFFVSSGDALPYKIDTYLSMTGT